MAFLFTVLETTHIDGCIDDVCSFKFAYKSREAAARAIEEHARELHEYEQQGDAPDCPKYEFPGLNWYRSADGKVLSGDNPEAFEVSNGEDGEDRCVWEIVQVEVVEN